MLVPVPMMHVSHLADIRTMKIRMAPVWVRGVDGALIVVVVAAVSDVNWMNLRCLL